METPQDNFGFGGSIENQTICDDNQNFFSTSLNNVTINENMSINNENDITNATGFDSALTDGFVFQEDQELSKPDNNLYPEPDQALSFDFENQLNISELHVSNDRLLSNDTIATDLFLPCLA